MTAGWRCVSCDEPLAGGDHGPYLDAVLAHLRTAHAAIPFEDAWEGFSHRWGNARRPRIAT